jgi:hypothetical protein
LGVSTTGVMLAGCLPNSNQYFIHNVHDERVGDATESVTPKHTKKSMFHILILNNHITINYESIRRDLCICLAAMFKVSKSLSMW